MPISLFAAALCLTPAKVLWTQILRQSPSVVEKLLGAPTKKELSTFTDYDPRWIKWVGNRGRDGMVVDHDLELEWDRSEYAIHDEDLWNGRVPQHPGAAGSWIAYLGAPLAELEKVAGKPIDVDDSEDHGIRVDERTYRMPKFGELKVSTDYLNPKAPVVVRIQMKFGAKTDLGAALKKVGVTEKLWRDTKEDPNFDATLFYPLGPGVFRQCTYNVGAGETMTVSYVGPKGKETARQFTYQADPLGDLIEAAARFGYRVLSKNLNDIDGVQSDWSHLRTHALRVSQPQPHLVISTTGLDLSDLR
ncbi:hypothetical protein EON81_00265 [bacterium]|nr:MAG: hypothetical protein EON81_00265 [bacterium]